MINTFYKVKLHMFGVHIVMGLLFLVWGDANGKFTYVPKYKPGISKLDYTNSSLVKSHRVPGILLPVSS